MIVNNSFREDNKEKNQMASWKKEESLQHLGGKMLSGVVQSQKYSGWKMKSVSVIWVVECGKEIVTSAETVRRL